MFVMQTSAMKTCFQIAECNFSYAKLSNISVTSKYLNEINIIIGQITELSHIRKLKELR